MRRDEFKRKQRWPASIKLVCRFCWPDGEPSEPYICPHCQGTRREPMAFIELGIVDE